LTVGNLKKTRIHDIRDSESVILPMKEKGHKGCSAYREGELCRNGLKDPQQKHAACPTWATQKSRKSKVKSIKREGRKKTEGVLKQRKDSRIPAS